MAKEIERKFLVSSTGWKKWVLLKRVDIKQGYISKATSHVVRVRVSEHDATLTIKGPKKDITRDEFEYSIPVEDGNQLLKMCDGPIISKTRHYVQDPTHGVWEVDVYKGINRGLVVAEFEMTSSRQVVKLPEWVGKEVSHDKRYTNTYLATHKVEKQ